MCCRSPAITWPLSRASSSSPSARRLRSFRLSPAAIRSRNGRRSRRCCVAAFYLLLSGAEVATQRAFIMTAIVLIGVMFDRPALTLRTIAVAALAVLLIAPQALVHPSFQMSFAATLALVAAYERGLPWFSTPPGNAMGHADCALGRAGSGRAHHCVDRRGPRHNALCRLPFPSSRALWRDRQSPRHADCFGLGDAGGLAGVVRHSVRLRRLTSGG